MKLDTLQRLIRFAIHFVYRSKGRFYLYLALFCSVLVVLDATTFHLVSGMRLRTFDTIMKHRLVYRAADPDLVVVDIDEGSLAAMAKEYGRWPWPRQVFAELVENLEPQHPKAIVFDILFSDPDVSNPDSDDYFNEVIAASDNTYFPMLRLNPKNDSLSQVTPAMIPGMQPLPGAKPGTAGIALILPHFPAIVASGRMGTNNIDPDQDGIVRQYTVYREHHGWRIPSLPARMGELLGWPQPQVQEILLNWRGGLGAFQTVRFSDLYQDFLRPERQRPADEFAGKIVIIGSTAPGLFDTKPTPMERVHPGVEILATAIDNLKNGDWITPLSSPWIYSALSLGLIWLVAIAFLTGIKLRLIDGIFAGSQVGLIAVSYASLNLSTYYIDLTAPITAGFVYFTLARVYAYAEVALAERRVWFRLERNARGWQQTVVAVVQLAEKVESDETQIVTGLKRRLNARREGFSVEIFPRKPAGVGRAFGNLLLIYWVDERIVPERPTLSAGVGLDLLPAEIAAVCGEDEEMVAMGSSSGAIPYENEEGRIEAWRALVLDALRDLHTAESAPGEKTAAGDPEPNES